MEKHFTTFPIWRIILTAIRLYLGWTWINAGFEKLSGGSFSIAGFVKGALTKTAGPHAQVQTWWADFLQHFAIPNMSLFDVLVPWGEFFVGVSLILGIFTKFGVLMGMAMNFSYMLSGSISTNPQMLLLEIIIFIHSSKAALIGLDYWVIPKIQPIISSIKQAGSFSKESQSA